MPKPYVILPPQPAIQLRAVPPQSVHSSFSAQGWLLPQTNQEHSCLFQDPRPMHSSEVTKADWAIKDSSAFLKWPWIHSGPSFFLTKFIFELTFTSEHRADPANIPRPGNANANRYYKASCYQEYTGRLSLFEAGGQDSGQ